ncbi:hypothetical protein [Microlunatus flavus]|uniref:Uncharacterized protein n=1 Tax=Microlunatus flavus TaxID=1036181 RepID=A0A1H8Z849_9ACTN|nr:hypothetical protein [Microlunatus flavus]SEP60513.1 hypothetical protein SAMN05421756_101134 [Microlunatus flavus]
MSSVLHPVGPEPRERYWVRRVAVLVAAVVAIGIVIALVGNAMSAGSAVQAEPAPPSVSAPTLPPTPSASPSAEATASPTASGSPTPGSATPSAAAPSSAAPTPSDTVTPDPKQKPKSERSTPPTSTDKKKAEQQAAEKKAAAKKKKAATVLASCPADDVRSTLTGPRKVKAGKSAKFSLSLINGSDKSCYAKVTGANFRLTIVSGSDRIWSSEDCPKAVPAQSRKLTPQKSVDWTMRWDGTRSGKGCKERKESPEAGYYWAIANFDDAREVRWRLILT